MLRFERLRNTPVIFNNYRVAHVDKSNSTDRCDVRQVYLKFKNLISLSYKVTTTCRIDDNCSSSTSGFVAMTSKSTVAAVVAVVVVVMVMGSN